MGQRLGIATALLGDPQTVMLDEPVNGLDPEGIHWIRNLLKRLAAEGRTVFVSSHLMSEMALTADHLIVIGRGKLIADTSVDDFVAARVGQRRPRSLAAGASAARVLAGPGVDVIVAVERRAARGARADGRADRRTQLPRRGIVLHELTPQQASLEEAFMDLTRDDGRVQGRPSRETRRRRQHEHASPHAEGIPRSARGRVTQLRVILSEWTKLRVVRSTRWSLLAAFVFTIGVPGARGGGRLAPLGRR